MKNCLTYAAGKFVREGGYLMMRKSLFASEINAGRWHPAHLVPHFLHSTRDGQITQYAPTQEQRELWKQSGGWRYWIRLWHFHGRIVEGDCDAVISKLPRFIPDRYNSAVGMRDD